MKKIFLILSILSLALSPIVVGAAETCTEYCDNPNTETMPDGQVCYCNPLGNEDSDKSLSVIIEPIINFIFNLSVVVVPVLVITGAFLITTAGGDEERIKKGKDIIMWTLIGFLIVLLSQGLSDLLYGLLGI